MITYTNHVSSVVDALRYLLVSEFQCSIRMAKDFEPDQLNQGEYFRYYLSEQPVISFHSDGETRDYTFDCAWYFDETSRDFKELFDNHISKRTERLKELLHDNRNYIPSSVYKWHMVRVEIGSSGYVDELGSEFESYSNILFVPVSIIITRNDIR